MSNSRTHRGAHPLDPDQFSDRVVPTLQTAVAELSWLLCRGYQETSAVKLVGDRHQLTRRQRHALVRSACTDKQRDHRKSTQVQGEALARQHIAIDGFNTLITLERALSGGPVLVGRDGAMRDLAGVHGTWRAVSETPQAVVWLGQALQLADVREVTWLLDQPVSNSGRLAALLRQAALDAGWPWTVQVEPRVDPLLAAMEDVIVATSDSWILDQVDRWVSLVPLAVAQAGVDAWWVQMSA